MASSPSRASPAQESRSHSQGPNCSTRRLIPWPATCTLCTLCSFAKKFLSAANDIGIPVCITIGNVDTSTFVKAYAQGFYHTGSEIWE